MDELCGDAQQFGGLVGAVGEPLGEGVAFDISRVMASSSSRMPLASNRASAVVLSSVWRTASGTAT